MHIKPKPPICQQLSKAYNMICNALSDSGLQDKRSSSGAFALDQGLKLYRMATMAEKKYQALKASQLDGTSVMVQISNPALDAYQSLYRIICGVWDKGKSGLEAGGICGKLSKTTGGFLSNADALFEIALKNLSLSETLKKYGYSKEKLKSERDKIKKMEHFHRHHISTEKSLKRAACARQKAFRDLAAWTSGYSKNSRKRSR
jgi:hypothetical protein